MNASGTNFPLANTRKVYSRDANLWRSKIWRLSFIHSPPPLPEFQHAPATQQIDPAPNGNDLGYYMKSYMKYILSKATIIILMPEIIFLRWLPYPFNKCPAPNSSCCVNKKNS